MGAAVAEKMDEGKRRVLERRAQMEVDARKEARAMRKAKRPIEERLRERNWPLDAATGRRADIDPQDVSAPLPEEPLALTAEQIAEAARAPSAFASGAAAADEHLRAVRRKAHQRLLQAREAVRGAVWTEELVERRVEEAFRTLFRTEGGRHGPRQYGSAMPAIVRDWKDLVDQAGNKSLRKAAARLLRHQGPPSVEEVRRMEETLAWSLRYLKDLPPDLATFLNLGGMWKAWGAPISRKCAELGVARQVFYRDRKDAVRMIVEGLKRDGKAPT